MSLVRFLEVPQRQRPDLRRVFAVAGVCSCDHEDSRWDFVAQKVTKMLVALKTRLFIPAFVWFPGLLARLFLFHVLFLSFVVPYRVLSVHETGRMRCSDSLARQSLLIEMISLNDFVAHEMREFVFFFSGKKNQKARAPKNSLIQLRISLAFWYAHASMYFNILFLVFDYYQIES